MPRQATVFEREPLYAEVWAEPLRTVAARYDLSDVGLRKICTRLGVPTPPLGYWAKVAAGKAPRVTPLSHTHKGQTRYVRDIYIDEKAPERGRRVEQLLNEKTPPASAGVGLKASLDVCHVVVQRTGKRMARRRGDERHLLHASGGDVLEVAVSESLKNRALILLDAVLTALLAVGGTLVPSSKDGERLYVCMLGQVVGLRVEEIVRREERKLSAAENVAKKKDPYFYFRDRWIYIATGKLKLTLLSDYTYYQYVTLSDGVNSLIEDRIEHIAERVQAKAADRQVKKQMDEEERLRREAAWAQRKEMERVRDAELAQLEKAEKKAAKWRRAQELRAYAGALEGAKVDPSNELATNVAWLRNAADWLDPLVGKKWPAVDI